MSRMGRQQTRRSASALFPPGREQSRTPFKSHIAPEFDVGDGVIGIALSCPVPNPRLENLPALRQLPRIDNLIQTLNSLRIDAAVNVLFFGGVLHRTSPSKTIFFFAKTATVLKAFSGADMSRARSVRVHRRPLTGSTAGITPVLSGAG